MVNVQFNDPYANASAYSGSAGNENKGLIGLLLKWGLAGNAKQANVILIIIMIVSIALAFFVYPREPEFDPNAPGALGNEFDEIIPGGPLQ